MMWHHLQKRMHRESKNLEGELLEALAIRQSNIHYDILEEQLEVVQHQKLRPFDF